MAANDALLASLLLGQKQRRDPLEIYQSFGKQQVQAGSSTAPLGSGNALEGIARALQGGIGGLMQGYGLGKQEEQDTATSEGLQKAALAKTPEEYAEAMKGVRGSEGNAVLGQIAQNRLAEILLQRQAGNKLGPLMGDPAMQTAAAAQAPQGAPMQQGGGAAPPGGIPQPGYGASTSPGGVYQARLSGYESTDRPQIVNPQSGAGGLFQFLPGTWDETRKANPHLNLPATVGQANEVQQKAAEEAFRAGNAKALQAAGIEPTPGNLYLAHRAGAQGAQTILQASPDTPLSTIVPPIWLQQNPDMRTTAGQFVAQANQRFPGGGQAAPGSPGPVANPPQVAQGSSGATALNQGPPTAVSSPAGDQLRQRAQAAQQAGDNVTALKFAQEAAQEDAKHASRSGEVMFKNTLDATEWDRRQAAEAAAKEKATAQTLTQPTTVEMHKLRDARAEGQAIIGALQDFKREFEKGPGLRSVLGVSTPANTSYNNATLLMKGEALYNLGVLSGPDLEIIRRILPDPSTFAGLKTSKEEMNTAVGKITDLINARISAKEAQLGQSPAPAATPAPLQQGGGGGIPAPPPGFRPLP